MKSPQTDGGSSAGDECDPQKILLDWILAARRFHQYYHQLTQLITDYKPIDSRPTANIFNKTSRWSISDLKQLQLDALYQLAELERSVNGMDETQTSITRHLRHDTATLAALNKRIQHALRGGYMPYPN